MRPIPRPCVCTSVRKISREVARVYDDELAPSGLSATQLAVMRSLQRHEGEPLTRSAEDLNMDRTSFYRALGPLRRDGLVEIGQGDDARSRTASITAEGARKLRQADPLWDSIQVEIVERFGRKAWRDLTRELVRLREIIDEYKGRE